VKDVQKNTLCHKTIVILFSCFITFFQFGLSVSRLVFSLLGNEKLFNILHGVQVLQFFSETKSLFHVLICFIIAIICAVMLLLSKFCFYDGAQVSQRKSQITFLIISCIWMLMILRGIANIVFAILEFGDDFNPLDLSTMIINLAFSIIFDWLPMIFMGITAIIQDNPTDRNAKNPEFVRLQRQST
jgi:hypothetical protein